MDFTLVDSHCHFDFPEFDHDRSELWQQCKLAGIQRLLIPGCEPGQWSRACEISQQFDGMAYAAGLHPWWVPASGDHTNVTSKFATAEHKAFSSNNLEIAIAHELNQPNCIALGECGLDKPFAQRASHDSELQNTQLHFEQQLNVFKLQVKLAIEFNLPLIIHSVKAHNEVLQVLNELKPQCGGVVHAFSGHTQIAEAYWRLGFRLGIGGTLTYARAKKTREAVAAMPLAALLLETDAPDMRLQGQQGQRNSPENVVAIAHEVAELKSLELQHVAEQTTQNYLELFGDH